MRTISLARHGEHAEGIGGAQILLGGEREFREVGQPVQIVGMNAGRGELRPIMRHAVIGARQDALEPLELERAERAERLRARLVPAATHRPLLNPPTIERDGIARAHPSRSRSLFYRVI